MGNKVYMSFDDWLKKYERKKKKELWTEKPPKEIKQIMEEKPRPGRGR